MSICAQAWTCFPCSGFTSSFLLCLPFLTALLLLEISIQAKGGFYIMDVAWDFFFPSSKFVICFLPEHFPLPPLPCLCDANRTCCRHWCPHVLGTHCGHTLSSLPWCWLLSCLLKLSLIFSGQLFIRSEDENQSVSPCHLAISAYEEGILKCQR